MISTSQRTDTSYKEPKGEGRCYVLCLYCLNGKGKRLGQDDLDHPQVNSPAKTIKMGLEGEESSFLDTSLAQLPGEALAWNCLRRRK